MFVLVEIQYTLDVCLNQVKEKNDLAIRVSCDLSPRSHIPDIIKKANQKNR